MQACLYVACTCVRVHLHTVRLHVCMCACVHACMRAFVRRAPGAAPCSGRAMARVLRCFGSLRSPCASLAHGSTAGPATARLLAPPRLGCWPHHGSAAGPATARLLAPPWVHDKGPSTSSWFSKSVSSCGCCGSLRTSASVLHV